MPTQFTVLTTTDFDLSFDDIVDQAYARVYGEQVTGKNAKDARIAANMLLQTWANRGIYHFLVDKINKTLEQSEDVVEMPVGTVDVLEVIIGDDNNHRTIMTRVGRREFEEYRNTVGREGRPEVVWINRQRNKIMVNFYPSPKKEYQLEINRLRQHGDIKAMRQGVDIPMRWKPALISGMASMLGRIRKQVGSEMQQRLDADAENDFQIAYRAEFDRSEVNLNMDMSCYTQGL